ncbi:MAG: RNA polymerase sigma factor [Flavisolibacter sp.]
MRSDPANDRLLWQQFQEGDRRSFALIYQMHFASLFEYGLRLAASRDMVKDCIHDLFVKLWSNKLQLGQVSNVRSYLLVSLRGTIYNKTEREKKVQSVDPGNYLPFEMKFAEPAEAIGREDRQAEMQKLLDALDQLSPRQKELIYLKYFEELGYEEIAAIMGISIKATYKLSARALEVLRQIMNTSMLALLLSMAALKREMFGG